MKRFTVLFAVLGVLMFSAFFQAWAESRAEAKKTSIAPVYDATSAMLEAINAKEAEVTIPLLYDAKGEILAAIGPKEVKANNAFPIVYDATGAMLDAINP